MQILYRAQGVTEWFDEYENDATHALQLFTPIGDL